VVHCRQKPQDLLPFAGIVSSSMRQQVLSSATSLADEEERRVRALFDAYCARNDVLAMAGPRDAPMDRPSASWSEEVGKQADLALYTLDELRFSGAGDPLAALVLCGAHAADRVMVKGDWRVVDGVPVGVDVATLRHEHGEAAKAFLART